MPTVSQTIAARLAAHGVRHAFGIPGGEVLSLIDALEAAGIRFVLAKHENGAGFMAEGVHHRAGAPAVLVATLGPGVSNAITVIANAQQDRVPLIFLTGCLDAAEAVTYNHQIFDHRAVLRPLVKASWTATPGAMATLMEKAIALATADPWGPVHIDLPIRVAGAEEPEGAPLPRARHGKVGPVAGEALDRARAWLAEAERPLVIAGLEALQHGAEAAVADFVRRFRAPLLTTYKAKGILPEDDPLSLMGAGLSPVADRVLLPVVQDSDCIVLAGYDPIEMRVGWRNPWRPEQRVIELSAVPNSHDMHQARIAFVGDIGAGLAALGDGIAPRRAQERGAASLRARLDDAFGVDEKWGPAAIVTTMREAAPRNAIATCDAGAHRILFSQVWRCYEPRSLLQSTGLCTMGCALPLAIGAKLADPARAVICFTGDAGLEMILGELATARDLKLPVVVVVFVDASLSLIELKQRGSNLANAGVDFGETDFAGIARALGGRGYTVESRAALEEAARAALADDVFSVIACRFPRGAYDGRI